MKRQKAGKSMEVSFGSSRMDVLIRVLLVLALLLVPSSGIRAAEFNYAYPKVSGKKGLYVCPGMEEDAVELGVQHATLNLSISHLLPPKAFRNNSHCISYDYQGTRYWFSRDALGQYDTELERLSANNVLVTVILLLPDRSDDLSYLIYPAARGRNANYYQWNMKDERAVKALRAVVTFIQRRYTKKSGARVVGWIVGNEVNNTSVWNWAGYIGVDTYVDLYAAQVAEVRKAARSVFQNARVYISLDHYWSVGNGSYWYAGKDILTKFAKRMSARGLGKGTWCIAYHPYNISQYEPNIMSTSDAVTKKTNTRIITMKNLSVLTEFARKKYSKNCRVILSEQGYSSLTAGSDSSKEQARNIALALYIAQQNSMVDSLILHRQVDHTAEGERYGLYTSWGMENASAQKLSWTTYKYADTTRTDSYTKYAEKQAKKLSGKKVKKLLTVKSGRLKAGGSLSWKKKYTGKFAGFGALGGFEYRNGVYFLQHDYSRNPNVPWGMIRKGKINCKKLTRFGFGVFVSASQSGKALVYLRLWSGARNYYDASVVVSCGVKHALSVNLKDWKRRNQITKVEILIRPDTAGWNSTTSAQIDSVGIR